MVDALEKRHGEVEHSAAKKSGNPCCAAQAWDVPSHPLPDYVGDYQHRAYGRVSIERDGQQLRWKGLGIDIELGHRHYDIFDFPSEPADDTDAFIRLAGVGVFFGYDAEGDVDRISISLEPLVPDAVFRRTQLLDPTILQACVGAYEFGARMAVVALEGRTTLTLSLTGDPNAYHLCRTAGPNSLFKNATVIASSSGSSRRAR